MTRWRKAGIVAAMWGLGLAMLAGLAWAVNWRESAPVRVPVSAAAARAPSEQMMGTLTAGAARSADTAAEALRAGRRSEAMHALDAAARVVEVGRENSYGRVRVAYTIALKQIRLSRHALYQARPGHARSLLRRSAGRLRAAAEPAAGLSASPPPPLIRSGYRSAVLLNANGAMIGRVQSIERGPDPVAVVHLGGVNDMFGLVELGGRQGRVPAARLLWGPRRSLGSVYVVLPHEATQPTEVLAAVQ
jgi:hypothetical protein